MGILSWIIGGLFAGWIAGGAIRKGKPDLFADALLGAFGAMIGGYVSGVAFGMVDPISVFNLSTLMVAFWVSVVMVAVVRVYHPGHSPA